MTVSIYSKSKKVDQNFDLTNGTWFELIKCAGFGEILHSGLTNDSGKATPAQCKKLLVALALYEPSAKWFVCHGYSQDRFKSDMMMFFAQCSKATGFHYN